MTNHYQGIDIVDRRLVACTSPLSHGSFKKRKVIEDPDVNGHVEQDDRNQVEWQKLYQELQAERVTKAEALLHAHVRETEEREGLMRSYNQDLESENRALRAKVSKELERQLQLQDLQSQVKELQSKLSIQGATIHAYQKLTGATLSQVRDHSESGHNGALDCECTMENMETKTMTKFRISTVSVGIGETAEGAPSGTILKYCNLENPDSLPEFLRDEIEFESSQLPPLLQNILCGIFPEEE